MKIVETYTRPDDMVLPEDHKISHCTAETFRQLIFDFLKKNLQIRTFKGINGKTTVLELKNPHTGQMETIDEI